MIRNRNLGWVAAAKALYLLGGSHPMSASTVGMLGRGRKGITPRLLADFAAVLGIDAGDLSGRNVDYRAWRVFHPGRAGGLWLRLWRWRTLVRSLFQAVVVPSGFSTTVQPLRWISTWW